MHRDGCAWRREEQASKQRGGAAVQRQGPWLQPAACSDLCPPMRLAPYTWHASLVTNLRRKLASLVHQ